MMATVVISHVNCFVKLKMKLRGGKPISILGLNGRLDYADPNHIEKWFRTLKMRIGRFHSSWVGSRRSVRQWFESFIYYNFQ